MLNSPGEEVAASPAADTSENNENSPVLQITLIIVAGLYLFGMVWLYAQFPWAAVAGAVVAMIIIAYGVLQRLRNDSRPPDA